MTAPPPTASDDRPMVELRGVSRRFGAVRAVEGADLAVGRGAFLTILGPSGCGKTTLLRLVAGFLQPSAGEIVLDGRPVSALPPHRRSIGMVFQRLALFPHMTAAENVAYPLRMRRFPPAQIAGRVARYLSIVRLDGLGDRRPNALSGGQQQRVAIARALVFDPALLLLDEPLSALDRKLREEMQLEFRRIQQELGVTTINVTHDQREALVMSDRVVVMRDGVIQQADDPVALYRSPANRFVAGFVGLTAFLPGVARAGGRLAVGEVELAGRAPGGPPPTGAPVDGALRAEQVRVLPPGAAADGLDAAVDGVVRQRIFEGDRVVYEIACPRLGGALLYAFDHDPTHHAVHEPGAPVRLGWNARDLLLFPREPEDGDHTKRQEASK